MKTEEEIREELKENRDYLKDKGGYVFAETWGYVQALKWVLEDADNEQL